MAEIVLLLVIKKIGVALANGVADQAKAHFFKYATQLTELQRSMGRVMMELRVIHDVLCQTDIRNRNDPVYDGWLDEVRKVAHVMEDMVDEYLYQVGWEHDIGCCFYLKKGFRKPRSLLSLNQIASNMKETEKDLAHLSEMKNRWVPMVNNGDNSNSNYIVKRSQDLANISHSLDEEDLVGVDKNREILQQWLGGEDAELSVITVHGMGGLRKTALAANVYRKEREKFQCHAWVSISQTYSREDVLMNIVKELFKDRIDVPPNIGWSQLREDPLPSLSRLANLTLLHFRRAYNGEKLEFLTGWFPKLKVLILWDLPNLKQLEIKQGAMTNLERLSLANLSSMVEVPPGIGFLMPLQRLGFFQITPDFLALLRQCPGIAGMQWEYTLRD
uniref:Uncharacterized protein n=1 Tax=Avena sativa TaxID=4498 RepID=A0ACD5UH33_AVESA